MSRTPPNQDQGSDSRAALAPEAPPTGHAPRWPWHAGALALTVLVCALLFAETRDAALLGWDSYPIIITARVQSVSDFFGTFTERLMDGRYPGSFYRPLFNLTIALDAALSGLSPTAYQLDDVVCFGACALALYWLARRSLGTASLASPLAALFFFLLHPTHVEVLPVPPRRPELLCGLFMALALAAQLAPRRLTQTRLGFVPAAFTLLALLSKETALVLPGLILVALVLYVPLRGMARWRQVAWLFLPHVAATVLVLGLRFAVLGQIGGHSASGTEGAGQRWWALVPQFGTLLLAPQPPLVPGALWVAALASIAAVATLLLGYVPRAVHTPRGNRTGVQPAGETQLAAAICTPGRALLLSLCWLGAISVIYALAGLVRPWYALLLVAGAALAIGALVEAAWQGAWPLLSVALRGKDVAQGDQPGGRSHRSRPASSANRQVGFAALARRATGATALVLLAILLLWQAAYAPALYRYEEWPRATRASAAFLAQLKERLDAAAPGSTLYAPPIPMWVVPEKDRPQVRGAAVLTDYSVQAWVELMYPQRRIRVVRGTAEDKPAGNEIIVRITQRQPGY